MGNGRRGNDPGMRTMFRAAARASQRLGFRVAHSFRTERSALHASVHGVRTALRNYLKEQKHGKALPTTG